MKRLGTAPEVDVDWTKRFAYTSLVEEEISVYSTIEVTSELKEGGVAANEAWLRWYRFLAATWQTDFVGEVVKTAERFDRPRLLSLGCGYGGMELDCARRLRGRYELLAVDLNEHLFRAAREEVSREGLEVEFQAVDLNFATLPEHSFDVVFAHASLHHLLNFEHLFAQVHGALADHGRLIVLDLIGKSRFIFWPENVRFATELLRRMPERFRAGLPTDLSEFLSSYLQEANQHGMEGIRQEELEEQLERWFRSLQKFKFNAFVRLLCTQPAIAPRFDPTSAEDLEYLDGLYRLDLQEIAAGRLRPTEMFAVYQKRPASEVPAARAAADAERAAPR